MELHEGFSQRLNEFLDTCNFPDGRSRCSALAEYTEVSTFTSQRMVYKDTPCRNSTLHMMIEKLKPASNSKEIREIAAQLLYGVGPEKFLEDKKDISLVGHIAIAVEMRAEGMGIDILKMPTSSLEDIWDQVYKKAIKNGGKIDHKYIAEQLIEFIPE